MCGIAGLVLSGSEPSDKVEAAIRRMIVGIKHRGPDDDGYQILSTECATDGIAAIANTRLAILDLSPAGHQPMHDPETGNWIAFNGEIYNHLEIRAEIGERTGKWRSQSDTETILHAYRLWGRDCIQRLRGMFAFAIWDAASGKLWCVRDRLGIKPFYYCALPAALLFASEVHGAAGQWLVPGGNWILLAWLGTSALARCPNRTLYLKACNPCRRAIGCSCGQGALRK